MKTVSVIILTFFAFREANATHKHSWSYDDETQWPGYCNTGTRQSPINIMSRDALEDKFESLEFHGYESVELRAKNNHHTLQWNNLHSRGPTLSGGPLRGKYTLKQFHFHWLSEHAIDGRKYPLEIHFVHVKHGLSEEEALLQDDGLTVIAIMCEVHAGEGADLAFSEIIQDVPNLVKPGSTPNNSRTVDINQLFSANRQSYFTYHGSLTTPDCNEVVTWIVMDELIIISDDQFKLISKVDVGTIFNYRSLQPVNRVVYKSSPAPCAHHLTPSFLATTSALVQCFSSHLSTAMKEG